MGEGTVEVGRIYPKTSAWALLLIPMSFPLYLAVALFVEGAVWYGLGALAFTALIVGYNATSIVVIDRDRLSFRRYFIKLWSIDLARSSVRVGLGGEVPMLPSLLVQEADGPVHYIIMHLYARRDLDRILRCLGVDDTAPLLGNRK